MEYVDGITLKAALKKRPIWPEKETGERIALSLLPDAVKSKASTNVITYNFITVGEVKMPNGQKLREFSWAATLPGAKAKSAGRMPMKSYGRPSC